MNNHNPVESKQEKSSFTVWTWLAPLIIGALSFFISPLIANGYADFWFFVFVAYFGIGMALGSFVGLGLGIAALLRKEPKRSAVWLPMGLYVAILILFCAAFFA